MTLKFTLKIYSRAALINQLKELTAFKAEPQKDEYELGKLGGALVKGAELISKG